MASLGSGSTPVLAESKSQVYSIPTSPEVRTLVGTAKANERDQVPEDKGNVQTSPNSNPKSLESGNRGTKRKAEDEVSSEEDVKDVTFISSAPTIDAPTSEEMPPDDREKTPGREGPIKEEDRSLEPDIKPFKGEPGRKVRKTASEKDKEYKKFVLETEGHMFHEIHVCFEKGPNGSPTYDKSGFQLDYNKVADWMKPQVYNKRRIVNGMNKSVERAQNENMRMAELFFEKDEAPTDRFDLSQGQSYWKDRVSKDLNIPWHKIGIKEFEEWDKRGFRKARRGEYQNPSEAEKKRMLRLMIGASLRK